MAILHAATLAYEEPGVINQLLLEAIAARDLGLTWSTRLFVPDDFKSRVPVEISIPDSYSRGVHSSNLIRALGQRMRFRFDFYRWLTAVHQEYDCILLRYLGNDPMLTRFLRKSRRPVVLFHHTKEIDELMGNGAMGLARARVESVTGRWSLKKAFGLVGVTREILDYEIQRRGTTPPFSCVYPNGALDATEPVADRRDDVPTFLFIAGRFAPWHGLDLLHEAVQKSDDSFRIHLVGHIPNRLQLLLREEGRFVLHGHLDHHGIRQVASYCWVGLSALAINRKGLSEACPLKTREYLAMGLPTYGTFPDVFPTSFSYYTTGPIEASSLLDVACRFRATTRTEVALSAYPLISKHSLLQQFHFELTRGLQ